MRRRPSSFGRPDRLAIWSLSALLVTLCGCEGLRGDSSEIAKLQAEPGRRLGHLDDPDLGFTMITGVEVDREGNLLVMEGSVPEIRVYEPDGSILRRIGRSGAGPGEFQGVPRFGLVGDTIWTTEIQSRRLTLFDLRGELLTTGIAEGVTVLLPEIFGLVLPHRLYADGTFSSILGAILYRSQDDPPTGVQPEDSIPVPIVRFRPDGTVIDTVGWMDRPPPRMWRRPEEDNAPLRHVEVDGRRVMVPRPPTTLPIWEAITDGRIEVETPYATSAEGGEIYIRRIGLSHDTIYSRTIPYVPQAYTSAELDALAESAAKGHGGGNFYFPAGTPLPPPPPGWENTVPRVRTAMDFPEFKLPIEYVWLAQDERLWMRMTGPDPAIGRWLILEPDGAIRGELELPGKARVEWSRGDAFWAVVPDELDVQWLVEYRIQG